MWSLTRVRAQQLNHLLLFCGALRHKATCKTKNRCKVWCWAGSLNTTLILKLWISAVRHTYVRLMPVCVCVHTWAITHKLSSFCTSQFLIAKPEQGLWPIKTPTGEHSKRLPSMNIYPEVLGRFHNIAPVSHSMSVSLSRPSVPSLALSPLTKAPCLHHFPGHLIVNHLTWTASFTDTLKVRTLHVWSLTEESTNLCCSLLSWKLECEASQSNYMEVS